MSATSDYPISAEVRLIEFAHLWAVPSFRARLIALWDDDPGAVITDEINADPDEVRALRRALADARRGRLRRREGY